MCDGLVSRPSKSTHNTSIAVLTVSFTIVSWSYLSGRNRKRASAVAVVLRFILPSCVYVCMLVSTIFKAFVKSEMKVGLSLNSSLLNVFFSKRKSGVDRYHVILIQNQ